MIAPECNNEFIQYEGLEFLKLNAVFQNIMTKI